MAIQPVTNRNWIQTCSYSFHLTYHTYYSVAISSKLLPDRRFFTLRAEPKAWAGSRRLCQIDFRPVSHTTSSSSDVPALRPPCLPPLKLPLTTGPAHRHFSVLLNHCNLNMLLPMCFFPFRVAVHATMIILQRTIIHSLARCALLPMLMRPMSAGPRSRLSGIALQRC